MDGKYFSGRQVKYLLNIVIFFLSYNREVSKNLLVICHVSDSLEIICFLEGYPVLENDLSIKSTSLGKNEIVSCKEDIFSEA